MDAATFWTVAGGVAAVTSVLVTVGWRIGSAVRASIASSALGLRTELGAIRTEVTGAIAAVDQRVGARLTAVERSVETIASAVVDQGNALAESRLEASRTYVERDQLRDVATEIRDNLARLEDRLDQKRPTRRAVRRSPPRAGAGLGQG